MESISVRGALRPDDLIPIARFILWKRSPGQIALFACDWILLSISLIWIVYFERQDNAITPALIGLFLVLNPFASPAYSIKRLIKSSPTLLDEASYQFDATSFRIEWPAVKVSMAWSSIHSVVEFQSVFAIFATKSSYFSVPKRLFQESQLAAFRELLVKILRADGKRLF